MDAVDCVVVGAGVIGLAIARALAQAGREVIVIEAQGSIGTGISSRNSEVIHAGLYYPPHSLKAKLCVRGRELLYQYCTERQIPFRRCGKLIVATGNDQRLVLDSIRANASACGLPALESLDRASVRRVEPELDCVAALFSPDSGIVDSHAFMLSLQADAESRGVLFAFHSPLVGATILEHGARLSIGGAKPMELKAHTVVNCAGLYAQAVARTIQGLAPDAIPTEAYAKGSYFSLAAKSPFAHLIYPVPEAGGLGVHLTLDLNGRAKFGPDVQWIDTLDYTVDATRAARFYAAIRTYWPALPDDALVPDYAGIRPKLARAGSGFSDFVFSSPAEHGAPGIYCLYAIESPGLTSALALAQWVLATVGRFENNRSNERLPR